MAEHAPGTSSVTDHRNAPRGVLPRNTQTWLMVGLAVGILGIIGYTAQPQPAPRVAAATATPAAAPNADRLRDYQDRLRLLDERSRLQAGSESRAPMARPTFDDPAATGAPAAPDPIEADRKRREYESLFSSNVVVSRRPDAQRLTTGAATPVRTGRAPVLGDDAPIAPP